MDNVVKNNVYEKKSTFIEKKHKHKIYCTQRNKTIHVTSHILVI